MKKITNVAFTVAAFLMTSLMFCQPGTLDSSFGTNGKVATNISENNQTFASKLQSDGKIVLVGNTFANANGSSFSITRYLTNGDLDLTFGNSGFATTLLGNRCSAHTVAIQSDGKIVVAGNTYPTAGNTSDSNIMVARYEKIHNALLLYRKLYFQYRGVTYDSLY